MMKTSVLHQIHQEPFPTKMKKECFKILSSLMLATTQQKTPTHTILMRISKRDTPVSTSHENVHGSGALGNEELQSSNEVNIVGDGCYSALDHGTEYSTLEPHVPKPYQEQLQPSTDDYSQLHHK